MFNMVGIILFIGAMNGAKVAIVPAAVLVAVAALVATQKQRQIASILKNAPAVPARSREQRDRIAAQSWVEASAGKKRFLLLFYPFFIFIFLAGTRQQLTAPGTAAHLLGVAGILGAVIFAVMYLRLLISWVRATKENPPSR